MDTLELFGVSPGVMWVYIKVAIPVLLLIIISVEFIYSIFKKDGVYSILGTAGNALRGLITKAISLKADAFYLSYFFVLYARPSSYEPFHLLSFMFCFIVLDLLYYIAHFLKHSFGFLWMFHAVHHNDDRFNMSTYLRASWIERLFITGLPLFVLFYLGFSISEIVFASFCQSIYQFPCHSQYLKFPKFLEWILITPSTHKIHHDQVGRNQNSNFGAVFSIWDRLFGTYVSEIASFTPGIKGYHQDNFIKMETDQIKEYLQALSKK